MEVVEVKGKVSAYEKIDKMIEEEFRNHPLVAEVRSVEPVDPSVRGKYSTKLNIDEKLDDMSLLREEVRRYVNEEVFSAFLKLARDLGTK